jgi:GreA/GreB family elongation factor
VVAPEEIPPNVVTMNSTVQFTIEETGKEFCLTLVYPRDMDGSATASRFLRPWAAPCWAWRWAMNWHGLARAASR